MSHLFMRCPDFLVKNGKCTDIAKKPYGSPYLYNTYRPLITECIFYYKYYKIKCLTTHVNLSSTTVCCNSVIAFQGPVLRDYPTDRAVQGVHSAPAAPGQRMGQDL